jgi:hypothetical protein
MPTGRCNFPAHHGPSASPPVGFLSALIAGAVIVAEWHTVLIVLAVVAVLAVVGVGAVMLVHSHRAEPYDATWAESALAEAHQEAITPAWQARVDRLEADLARALDAVERRPTEAPAQHLHLHGVSAADVAAIVRQNGVRAVDD